MSEPKTYHLTESELREYLNQSFDEGAKSALAVLRGAIDDLEKRLGELRATP